MIQKAALLFLFVSHFANPQVFACSADDLSRLPEKISYRDFKLDDSQGDYSIETRIYVDNVEAGSIKYIVEDGKLGFNFDISPNFRNQGLGKALVQRVLKRHPQIERISSIPTELNEAVNITALNLEVEGDELRALSRAHYRTRSIREEALRLTRDEIVSLKPGEAVSDYRERVLKAFSQTPTSRILKSFGFYVTDIEIQIFGSPSGDLLDFEYSATLEKRRVQSNQIPIVIKNRTSKNRFGWRLMPDGSLQDVPVPKD